MLGLVDSAMKQRFTLNRKDVRELDQRASTEWGMPSIVLMENAGRSAALSLAQQLSEGHAVHIFCGSGNNGGDGLVMARHLQNMGYRVSISLCARQEQGCLHLSPDCRVNYQIVQRCGLPLNWIDSAAPFTRADQHNIRGQLHDTNCWLVDSLFGIGLDRPMQEPWAALVDFMNGLGFPIYAVDVPTGMDCDQGTPLGSCIKATRTMTFVAWKQGFEATAAGQWTGVIEVGDIGVPAPLITEYRRKKGC